MNIDATTFRLIARGLLQDEATRTTPLTAEEATAIVQLGYLASGADLEDDSDEFALREQIGRHVCALAEIAYESVPRPSPLPLDEEERIAWLAKLGGELTTPGVSELAYVVVYLLMISDLELAPVESELLSDLQRVLAIGEDRAGELVAEAAAKVTPAAEREADGADQPRIDVQ